MRMLDTLSKHIAVSDNCYTHDFAKTLKTYEPATNKLLLELPIASSKDYHPIIDRLTNAHYLWKQVPAPVRGEFVRRLGEKFREHKEDLAEVISVEMGKIYQEALGEVQEMIDICDFAVGQSRMLYGNTMHSERPDHRMFEQWHPLGIVGVITAFNFPMAVWAWNATIAAICGNVVLWKPSSKTPLCAIAVDKIYSDLIVEMGLPQVFELLISDRETADLMLNDVRIPLISFTGSSDTGKHVYQTVAKRFGRCILECSGNNAIIVDKTADLKLAIPAIVFGAVGTAGQRCTTTRRLIVHKDIYNEVMTKILSAYKQLEDRIGHPTDPKTLVGPLIDQQAVGAFEYIMNCIRSNSDQHQARIVHGGNVITTDSNEKTNFVQPTIVEVKNFNDFFVQNETFAPILYVIQYETIEEAIQLQNNVRQGLSSSIFTTDMRVSELFLSSLGSDCGIANVNIGTSGAEIGGAFGGEKETGGGRESGSDSWKAYMRRQTNTINWGSELPLAQGIEFKL